MTASDRAAAPANPPATSALGSWVRDRLTVPALQRSAGYDPFWMLDNAMGPNPVWLLESLAEVMTFEPGMRVLDLGCGKALTSVFLAREFGVTVWAGDLWIDPDDNWPRIEAAGCAASVFPLRLEAHALPFASNFFDAVVSIDAYHYFGTDQLYLNYLTPFLRPGGQLGVVVPGLRSEPGDGEPPEHLRPFWDPDFATFHTAGWWERLWRSSGRVDVDRADSVPDGAEHWLRWMEVCLATGRTPMPEAAEAEAEMLRVDGGRELGFVRLLARRR